MTYQLEPVGTVEAVRSHAEDDYWGDEQACIQLASRFTSDALQGLEEFSHVEVMFVLHEVEPSKIVTGVRRPRLNPAWPEVGIFAQRVKNRPNRIATTICRVVRVDGTRLHVAELDAIDGSPVIDIKPVMTEFLPREEVVQPRWTHELMREYWLVKHPQ
ncbi:MAG: tRNA-Thr(GGU) m(6)t(6)A37 methyltransferase TsaA [Planctomycetota bacterium]|jgi:tRNA-Thr(GGU) m(6)t(6)A37 methyltransferase TsaA